MISIFVPPRSMPILIRGRAPASGLRALGAHTPRPVQPEGTRCRSNVNRISACDPAETVSIRYVELGTREGPGSYVGGSGEAGEQAPGLQVCARSNVTDVTGA